MPTESDRDSLARLAQDLHRAWGTDPEFPWDDLQHPRNQFFEGPAARLLQLGWRKAGSDQIVVSKATGSVALSAIEEFLRTADIDYGWTEYVDAEDELRAALAAALADPPKAATDD